MNKTKSDYTWQFIAPKGKEPTSLTKFGKTYHWCSTETGTPKGNGCDRWVCHKSSACEGLMKKRDSKQGATSDVPPPRSTVHTSFNWKNLQSYSRALSSLTTNIQTTPLLRSQMIQTGHICQWITNLVKTQ